MPTVDLHIHTTASDGRFSPEEIVFRAAERGLSVIAITDHDTLDGVAPALAAARQYPGLRVIPGVEISTDVASGEAHILGYFINSTHNGLVDALKRSRDSRRIRAQRMIDRLAELGIPVEWRRVQELACGSSIGRPHIAQAMLELDYIDSLKEAFNRYIGRDGSAYVERKKITPVEAVQLVSRAKGFPVLAHPFTVGDPENLIVELKEAGLIGIEAHYDSYAAHEVAKLVALADKYGLITTGGSDYHGLDENTETALGGVDVPVAVAERLIALAESRK